METHGGRCRGWSLRRRRGAGGAWTLRASTAINLGILKAGARIRSTPSRKCARCGGHVACRATYRQLAGRSHHKHAAPKVGNEPHFPIFCTGQEDVRRVLERNPLHPPTVAPQHPHARVRAMVRPLSGPRRDALGVGRVREVKDADLAVARGADDALGHARREAHAEDVGAVAGGDRAFELVGDGRGGGRRGADGGPPDADPVELSGQRSCGGARDSGAVGIGWACSECANHTAHVCSLPADRKSVV